MERRAKVFQHQENFHIFSLTFTKPGSSDNVLLRLNPPLLPDASGLFVIRDNPMCRLGVLPPVLKVILTHLTPEGRGQ